MLFASLFIAFLLGDRVERVEREIVFGADTVAEALTLTLRPGAQFRFECAAGENVGEIVAMCADAPLQTHRDGAVAHVDVPRDCGVLRVVLQRENDGDDGFNGFDGTFDGCLEAQLPYGVDVARTTLRTTNAVLKSVVVGGEESVLSSSSSLTLPPLRNVAPWQCTSLAVRYEQRFTFSVRGVRDVHLGGVSVAPTTDADRRGLVKIRDEFWVQSNSPSTTISSSSSSVPRSIVVELPCVVDYASLRLRDRLGKIDGLRILDTTTTTKGGTRVAVRPRFPLDDARTRFRLDYVCPLVVRARKEENDGAEAVFAVSVTAAPVVRDARHETQTLCVRPPVGAHNVRLRLAFPARENPDFGDCNDDRNDDIFEALDAVPRQTVCVTVDGAFSSSSSTASKRFSPVLMTWEHDDLNGVGGLRGKFFGLWARLFSGFCAISVARLVFGF